MITTIYILLGILIGCVIGWYVRSSRASALDAGVERELRESIRSRDAELGQLRNELGSLRKKNGELEAETRFLNERLAIERKQIESIQEQFRQEFEAISNKLLVHSSSQFDEQSKQSLKDLLEPFKDVLGTFQTSLDAARMETKAHSDLLKAEITRIGTEAANLSKALKGEAKVLGNWGENMLDQILEKSGLQRGIHYRRQRDARDANGDQRRLDVIVDLPEKDRHLVIDSKVSLRNFEDAVNAPDEATRAVFLDKHIENVRKHFRDLGGKRYHDIHGINAPDFVLMYVPIEAAFFAAIAKEPGLFAEALEHNVVLITNSTLLATLRTVAHVWRLADQQKHALEIADRGGKLHDKFVAFIEDIQGVGSALEHAQKNWQDASSKLHTGTGNLVRQAQMLRDLGAKASKSLPGQLVEVAIETDLPLVEITPTPTVLC